MRRKVYRAVRIGVYGVIAIWLLFNLVAWGFFGSYEEVGVGMRLAGFLLWGGMLSLGPLFLAAPPSTGKGLMKWDSPLALPSAVPLLCWLVALAGASELPLQAVDNVRSDAEILTYAVPLLMMLWLSIGALVLSLLLRVVQSVLVFLFRR